VTAYHGSPLVFSELQNASAAFDFIDSYSLKLDSVRGMNSVLRLLAVVLVLCLLMLLRKLEIEKKSEKKSKRRLWVILLVLDIGFVIVGTCGDGLIKPRSTVGCIWSDAMRDYGFFSCVLEDIQDMIDPYVKPDGYDSESVEAIETGSVQDDNQDAQDYPDIIFILNETFCDLSVYTDIQTDSNYLEEFYNKSNAIYGKAVVSEVGVTNNSEYEFLTSNSMYLLRSNAPFNYVDLSGHNIVQYLNSFHYETWGMHCAKATNYSRDTAYPALGFDNIVLGTEYFIRNWNGNRAYLDSDNYQELIKQYESGGENPRFLYMLTYQNHGSFEQNDSELDTVHTINDYGDLTDDVNEYLSSISLTAQAFTELTDYFSEVDRDVIICMVGDHAPSFITELPNSYNLDEDEKQIAMRTVPYVIWSNFEMETSDYTEYTTITDLAPMVLNIAGIPLDTYYQELIDLHNQVPIRTSMGTYVDLLGNIESYSKGSKYYDEITKYYCMEYKILTNP
jgi:phosphoglycerol transferase MdoB-like AlkP superfamily enzyme